MTDRLPPNLLALFQPRPPLRYMPPNDHAPETRKTRAIDGINAFLGALNDWQQERKDDVITESWLEKKDRETLEKQQIQKWLTTDGVKELYKPTEDENIRGDPFKTLFVSRLPYECGTKDLEKEFNRFGPIERIRVVTDRGEESKKKGKSRGYAFILFEREKDMKAAYKDCENLSIRGRKVMVDVERGRTVNDWRPRRFGGGLGGRHHTRVAKPMNHGYGPPQGPGFRGGGRFGDFGGRGDFRGGRGGRGGFRGGYGGGRGGIGFHGPPDGAPAGPRGPSGGGYSRGGFGGDRDGGRNANYEPLPPRGGRGYHDRDRDSGGGRDRDFGGGRDRDRDFGGGGGGGGRDRDYGNGPGGNKRPFEGGYDESRQRRRY